MSLYSPAIRSKSGGVPPTPQRKRVIDVCNDGDVLECGSPRRPLPLWIVRTGILVGGMVPGEDGT
ncbi:MAG: hypothetical protein DMF20_12050 [Verrucomicrobia bacterium]|nr:MAG: hypothetical protein DME48_00870 [Verrucomicrobiota bacterium]PYL57404.1 MAG: hypothetical protein DMF31_10765 [Verrucomicrobiota bacterium]PYL63679.1 MAG: hypothetical protein DMF20_12050 [Verrucomicrobiota bacterium]